MDDSNLAGEEIKEGFGVVRKDDGSVKLDRIEGELDREESATKRTARIYKELANTIMPASIQMEEDIGENHQSGRLPMLDTEVWIENGRCIRHSFYRKPMASVELVWERSALPISSKTNILLEEMGRRLRNCDPATPWAQKCEIISRMNLEMRKCGHREIF